MFRFLPLVVLGACAIQVPYPGGYRFTLDSPACKNQPVAPFPGLEEFYLGPDAAACAGPVRWVYLTPNDYAATMRASYKNNADGTCAVFSFCDHTPTVIMRASNDCIQPAPNQNVLPLHELTHYYAFCTSEGDPDPNHSRVALWGENGKLWNGIVASWSRL